VSSLIISIQGFYVFTVLRENKRVELYDQP